MRTVELVSGIQSSVLGFGCAPILGSIDGKTAQRAIDCAIDCGINHFDLARSYGYGEAEKFVGNILKGRRNQVVIASKFGIKANWQASLLKPMKPIVRFIRSKQTQVSQSEKVGSNTISAVADRFHSRIPYRGVEMRKSLEKSLKALRTDHLDYLFIHEPPERLIYIDELIETAHQLTAEGKIRALGLAFMNKHKPLHESYLTQFNLLQFDNPPNGIGYENIVKDRALAPNIIFSVMKGGIPNIRPADKLQQLSVDFPNSVILCSMFNEKHIRANATLL